MTSKETNIDSSYIYERSEVVPDWVNKLDDFKSKIKTTLHSTENGNTIDIQFCHPIDVPNSKK